jgi:hypothetical protein
LPPPLSRKKGNNTNLYGDGSKVDQAARDNQKIMRYVVPAYFIISYLPSGAKQAQAFVGCMEQSAIHQDMEQEKAR